MDQKFLWSIVLDTREKPYYIWTSKDEFQMAMKKAQILVKNMKKNQGYTQAPDIESISLMGSISL